MFEIKWNEKGLNRFYKKMDRLVSKIVSTAEESMNEIMEEAQEVALRHKAGKSDPAMIPYNVLADRYEFIGKLRTDGTVFSYASFLEYGTGTYAEREHIGKTKTFQASGMHFWYAPAESLKTQYGEDEYLLYEGQAYPYMATFSGKKYCLVFEQISHPFMRPTAFYMRDRAVEVMRQNLKKSIKEGIR